jgi:hypothetical protein
MLAQNIEVQLVRPPVPVRRAAAGIMSHARCHVLVIFHDISSFHYLKWCFLKQTVRFDSTNSIATKK